MEIAGLCLPLKPQKESFCSAIILGCAVTQQHYNYVLLSRNKMNGSGKDWIGLVIGEHWITWGSHFENIRFRAFIVFSRQ